MTSTPESGPAWKGRKRVLLTGAAIYSPDHPMATSMLLDGDHIAWLGTDEQADGYRHSVDEVVVLHGALVTPGFVDAHVHATSTGLTLGGLDLSRADSLTEALALVEAAARASRGAPLIGHGWDETRWPEGRPPTGQEIDRASWGSLVYLSRIDVHSAVVSSALLAAVPSARTLDGFGTDGVVSREAHHACRAVALRMIGAAQQQRAHLATRAHAASLGIVAMHEMAGPAISSADDLRALLGLSVEVPGPLVTGYWGEISSAGGVEQARELGAVGAAGDLFIDGAIGSRTACLRHSYLDQEQTSGAQYLTEAQVVDHVRACVAAGLQSGFHVIGDRATDIIMSAMAMAAESIGIELLRSGRHRLEHAEMLDDGHIEQMARLGMTASMQPMFDGLWGSAGGMYEQRLGSERAGSMNRFADLARSGVLLAFGSDSPVTDIGPWQAVRAAVRHHNPAQRVSSDSAFEAHTSAGWRAVGIDTTGRLIAGAPAHYVIWDTKSEDLGPDRLPRLSPDRELPRSLRTVVSGVAVHDTGEVAAQ